MDEARDLLLWYKVRKLNSRETKESYFIIEKIFKNLDLL
jgi:hypothetical protein